MTPSGSSSTSPEALLSLLPAQPHPVPPPSPLPPLLVGVSTKMYFTHSHSLTYLASLISSFSVSFPASSSSTTTTTTTTSTPLPSRLQLFFIPSFPSLVSCAQLLQSTSPDSQQHSSSSSSSSSSSPLILLGAQDCSPHPSPSPSTGSVSAPQLAEVGASLIELGHAERRAPPFSESDALVAEKVRAVVRAGLLPLVCVGEREAPRQGMVSEGVGRAVEQVWKQVGGVLGAVEAELGGAAGGAGEEGGLEGAEGTRRRRSSSSSSSSSKRRVVFAYEPVWAIGAEAPASADHVCAVVGEIKRRVGERWGPDGPDGEVRVLYGGSAGPGTWEGLRGVCDGLFLGRFAHEVGNVRRVVGEMLGEELG